jgi:hypothetical protein
MQPETWMTDPSWFLAAGLPWPEDQPDADVAEAAFVIAPYVTQAVRPAGPDGTPVPQGHDLAIMLDAGSRCAAALGKRVLFLSDITRWLADIGLSWDRIGVDFQTAQNELAAGARHVPRGLPAGLRDLVLRLPHADDPRHRGSHRRATARGPRTGQGRARGSIGCKMAQLRDQGAGERTARRLNRLPPLLRSHIDLRGRAPERCHSARMH